MSITITTPQSVAMDALVKMDYAISRIWHDGIIQMTLRADTSVHVSVRPDGSCTPPYTDVTRVQSAAMHAAGLTVSTTPIND
jgi:hypothetical protein